MIQNYLKTAFRHLFKNKLFSLINVLGLALGMACCFLIVLFLRHEFSYDQFHQKADRIYRVNYFAGFGNTNFLLGRVPPPISPNLPDYFPEIEKSARMFGRSISVSIKDQESAALNKYEVENLYFSDSTILDIFSFQFLEGNAQNALDRPGSLIITREMAQQFFGTDQSIGRTVHFLDQYPFEVTGVVESFPANSHIEFNMLAPYEDMFNIAPESVRETMRNNLNSNWVISHSYTFALLNEANNAEAVNARFDDFIKLYGNEKVRDKQEFRLFPLLDIHLKSTAGLEPTPTANLRFLYIFLAIGFITLLIACINFINFSTAGSLTRAREVGLRKVLGAGKRTLIAQFLGESLMLSFAAFLLSLWLVRLSLPFVNTLVDRQLSFSPIDNWVLLLLFLGIFFLAGLLAGSYPAFFITRFKPVSVLKGKGYINVPSGNMLRKILITTQFVASIFLIAGTLGIYRQLDFLRNQPMGFQTDYMLNVPLFSTDLNSIFGGVDGNLRQRMNSFEEALLTNPNVEAITLSDGPPGFGGVRRNVTTEQITADDNLYLAGMAVDYDFTETYQLEIVAGRDFDQSFGTDHQDAFIINEKAVEVLKWDSPEEALGKPLNRENKQGKVIGVVKNFHFSSLRDEIDPFLMDVSAPVFTNFSIRINAADVPKTIDFIQSQWNDFFPQKTFEYTFLDEDINQMYASEDQLARIIGYFALLAILISCFGLYGLVTYSAVQKTKEIGVRKVLGASISNILTLLSKEFIQLILIAGLIAIPLAYYGLSKWLEDYPLNVGLGWWLFVLPMIAVLLIALITLSYQTIRAALANPVEALRYE